jgi:hypothetical protein
MERTDVSVARFADHAQAETAVKTLAQAGFDMHQLSIVGRGYHTEESVIGFYNSEGRIRFWGKFGAFWGGLWGLFGSAIFLTSPITGPVMVLGVLAVTVLLAAEGAIAFGGASAIGAAIYSMGPQGGRVFDLRAWHGGGRCACEGNFSDRQADAFGSA